MIAVKHTVANDDFNHFMVIISRVIDLHLSLYRGGFKLPYAGTRGFGEEVLED